MITVHELPYSDERLAAIEEGFVPTPEQGLIIAAEEDGKIVGRMLLLQMAHIEGTWVSPEHRSGLVGAKLMARMIVAAKGRNFKSLIAYSRPETDDYMQRLGFKKMDVSVWVKEI